MLLRQQGRRHEHCGLTAVHHGDERRPHGDFGLAETDVAADQPVHRLLRTHILENRVDGGLLIGCLLEGKSGGEAVVFGQVATIGKALFRFTAGMDF